MSNNKITSWDKVLLARNAARPTAQSVINHLFPGIIMLHGDRLFKDDKAVIGGIAMFEGSPVTVIGIEKGVITSEKIIRNFGMPHPEGYRKALRLMKQAEKFKRPIITIIDTPGAYPGIDAERRGQARAIADNLQAMMMLEVPIIAVVLSEGGSGGALGIGVADKILMFENSIYSILSPEGFASILFKDSTKAKEAAELMKLTAGDLLDLKIIDEIILEGSGLHIQTKTGFSNLEKSLKKNLSQLLKQNSEKLLNNRYDKFRNMGMHQILKEEIVDEDKTDN